MKPRRLFFPISPSLSYTASREQSNNKHYSSELLLQPPPASHLPRRRAAAQAPESSCDTATRLLLPPLVPVLAKSSARCQMDEVVSASANSQTFAGDAATDQPVNVYVWDLDETLILLKSLLDGSFAGHFEGLKDRENGTEIGKRWENIILELCDEHFFYEEIENHNQPCLSFLREYDDGKDLTKYDFEADCFSSPYDDVNKRKLAYRFRAAGDKYAKGLDKILDHRMFKIWSDLYSLTDKFTDCWLSSAHKLLEEALGKSTAVPAGQPSSINYIVTSGSLVPSIAKCLLYRLDDVVSSDNVYSSWEVGKLQCFKWIKERHGGPDVRFCAVGDGPEERSAASIMKWPFIKIEIHPDAPHRFPGLSLSTIHGIMDAVYQSSGTDG